MNQLSVMSIGLALSFSICDRAFATPGDGLDIPPQVKCRTILSSIRSNVQTNGPSALDRRRFSARSNADERRRVSQVDHEKQAWNFIQQGRFIDKFIETAREAGYSDVRINGISERNVTGQLQLISHELQENASVLLSWLLYFEFKENPSPVVYWLRLHLIDELGLDFALIGYAETDSGQIRVKEWDFLTHTWTQSDLEAPAHPIAKATTQYQIVVSW